MSSTNDNMLCAICQDTFCDPVTALCGAHNYCKACLTQHIQACINRYQVPTCPSCRIPIQTSLSQLHVNVALRDAALASVYLAATSVAPTVAVASGGGSGSAKQSPLPISIVARRIADTDKVHIALSVPEMEADTTMTTVFITVVDISGSMGNSSVDNTQKTSDAAAFSRADLVRHAVATQIGLLRDEDEMALVLFDNAATIALPRTQMTAGGRAAAKACLPRIRPTGGTAIWAGLQKALTIAESVTNKNVVIILQTDGESDPSYNPPRGIPDTFRAWLDAHPTTKLTLHTVGYGFGDALDMPLLRSLSNIGSGTANYIPDGSMVGTVFIHLLANLMTCQYRGVKVHLPLQGQCIPIGFLQAGQTRDLILSLSDSVIEITATADNTTDHASFTLTAATPTVAVAEVAWPLIHTVLITELQDALIAAEAGAHYDLGSLISTCRAQASNPSIKALLVDLADPDASKGQLGKAFASTDAFRRWGRHYVPGVLDGHKNQWPINFKDACSTVYGSANTRRLIDRGDEIFTSLPPPTASCATAVAASYAYGGGNGTYVPVNSMATLHNSSGGCFTADCKIMMADIRIKRIADLKKGDIVWGGHKVLAVIYTPVQKEVDMVTFPMGLKITSWHPMKLKEDGEWVFPVDVGVTEKIFVEAYYNLVLESGHIIELNGYQVVTLGHNFYDNEVIAHPYFGTHAVIDDLKSHPDWESGFVVLDEKDAVRSSENGMIQKI